MQTLQEGQSLLQRIREMGMHADVQNRHATTAACYGIEHLLELLQVSTFVQAFKERLVEPQPLLSRRSGLSELSRCRRRRCCHCHGPKPPRAGQFKIFLSTDAASTLIRALVLDGLSALMDVLHL